MGTALNPATTSPASWDAFADVDAFVDAVLAELAAMAADGTRSTRSGPKPSLDAVMGLRQELAGRAVVSQSEGVSSGVRVGRLQASSGDSHGLLRRD
jgi:hypothetical protein